MPDKRWRGRWELSNSQTQTSQNTLKSKSIKTFEIWNFQFPRQFLRLSALPSWLATRCPGETWWTATSTTTGWPGSTALSPASGATRTTSRATPDQRGFQSAESWRSTSPVDRKIFYGLIFFHCRGRPGLVSAKDGVGHWLCGQEEVPAGIHWGSQDQGLRVC